MHNILSKHSKLFVRLKIKGDLGMIGQSAKRKIKVGDRIGDQYEVYQILGGEGKSGMGIVYVCYDHESRNVFALKTFQDIFLQSKSMRDSFEREALAWVHLEKHTHCVRAWLVQELDNRLYIALEFIPPDDEGRNTLTHYLESPLSLRQTLEWAIQFCYGMEHAYSHGVVVHRDIKPDNIMITRDKVVKITDFGLAVLRDQKDAGGVGAGTPPWMAPEQFEGITDIRSDIYGFGVMLYQMINHGDLPFNVYDPKRSDEENYQAYRHAHMTMLVPRLTSLLFPVIERCLEKDPKCRYQDFKELHLDLEKLYREDTGESPISPPTGQGLEAWEHNNKGLSLHTLGFHNEAITEFQEALRLKPDHIEAHNNLGIALAAKGRFDKATEAYQEFIRYAPPQYAYQIEIARQFIRERKGDSR